MSKAKLSLHSWDRLAPWSCGIVGKYLQPSHGNKTAPCQVSDLGVSDMDLNSQEGQCSHRKGLSPVSFTPLSLSVAVKNTQTLSLSLIPLYVFVGKKISPGKLMFTQTFHVSSLLLQDLTSAHFQSVPEYFRTCARLCVCVCTTVWD